MPGGDLCLLLQGCKHALPTRTHQHAGSVDGPHGQQVSHQQQFQQCAHPPFEDDVAISHVDEVSQSGQQVRGVDRPAEVGVPSRPLAVKHCARDAYGRASHFGYPSTDGLHRPRVTTVDHGKACPSEQASQLPGLVVSRATGLWL